MFKRIIVITVISILFICASCRSNTKDDSQSHASIDDIRFVELQIEAVSIDMYRYLGWLFEEKEMTKKASVKAIDNLTIIKDYLKQISFTDEMLELRDSNLLIIEKLIHIYEGIESKEEEEISKEFDECSEIYSQYRKKFEEYSKKHNPVEYHSEDLNMIEQEIAMGDDPEEEIYLLADILDAGEYSPVLLSTWYIWRAQTQLFCHGLSNRSEIPNLEYNKIRWKVVQTIKQHIETNPDDDWAKTQVRLLLDLSNIGRGGHFGNNALGMGEIY